MLPQQFSNPRLPEIVRKKKSACKINENDLKIAWKCTLRQSSFKNFPGRPPDPLIRGETLSYSPPLAAYAARYMPSAVNAPPPHSRLQTFWVQPWIMSLPWQFSHQTVLYSNEMGFWNWNQTLKRFLFILSFFSILPQILRDRSILFLFLCKIQYHQAL